MIKKVLVCDAIAPEGLTALNVPGVQVVHKYKQSEKEIMDIINEYEAVMVRSDTKITQNIIDKADNLKVIARAGVGVDNIDIDAATLKGIVVVNAPEGNTVAAAEHAFAMMMSLSRNIPQANALLKSNVWNKKDFMGVELRGKVLGVLGLGKIGSEVVKRAKSFEMKVIGYDPYITKARASLLDIDVVDLDFLLENSDFISMHLPKTDETSNLLNKERLAQMKDGVRIVNCARGGILNEKDLEEALKEGKVAGAALDVFDKEPTTESPLFDFNNVIVTPHLGASTEEAQLLVAEEVAEEVLLVLNGEPVKTAVNIPYFNQDILPHLKPFLGLAETLGRFAGQMDRSPLEEVKISYNGEITEFDLKTLTNTILKGMLRPSLEDMVNYVNAPLIAKNRGIDVKIETSSAPKDYANLIAIEVKVENGGTHKVAGTIFGQDEVKLVQLDGFSMDISPSDHLLILPHQDQPGMIGQIGMILGNEKVNIAHMQLGRNKIGGEAIMVMSVDHAVSTDAIEKMKEINGIFDVNYISL